MNTINSFGFQKPLFELPAQDFKKHLNIEGNTRILFSGKFGIGKTFFLDHFFKEETQKQVIYETIYRAFHLYPINYSIASNEDIFKYIKYDVITSMLSNGIKLENDDFSFLDTLPDYLRGNLIKVLATIVYMIPKVGKDIYDSYQKLEELKNDFLKHNQKANESDGDKLSLYLSSIENREGSIFENDVITRLIHAILTRIKQQSNKENVLIIDDLDRIDPEHIFRLLNVFAAHLDNPMGLPNKLGFDRVIIVCDINNIRNIFKAKYGVQTDFNGYIDKFYSHDVYHFDNRKILLNIAHKTFRNVSISRLEPTHFNYYISKIFDIDSPAIDLLYLLILNGMVSLRALITRMNNKIEVNMEDALEFNSSITISKFEHPIFIHFTILKEIVGGYEILKDFLSRIPVRGYVLRNVSKYCAQLMYYVYFEQTLNTQGTSIIEFNGKNLYIKLPEKVTSDLKDVLVWDTNKGKDIEYKFSIKEFQLLVSEFVDLAKRISG